MMDPNMPLEKRVRAYIEGAIMKELLMMALSGKGVKDKEAMLKFHEQNIAETTQEICAEFYREVTTGDPQPHDA